MLFCRKAVTGKRSWDLRFLGLHFLPKQLPVTWADLPTLGFPTLQLPSVHAIRLCWAMSESTWLLQDLLFWHLPDKESWEHSEVEWTGLASALDFTSCFWAGQMFPSAPCYLSFLGALIHSHSPLFVYDDPGQKQPYVLWSILQHSKSKFPVWGL